MRHFCLKCGKELKESQLLCPKCEVCNFLNLLDVGTDGVVPGILSAAQIEETMQWAKYKCGLNGSTGHGFTAEDANNLADIYNGLNAEVIGQNNIKGGPDRRVGDVKIQCKYYATPEKTVASLFENGIYTYSGQVAEVPNDQYDRIIELLEARIIKGEVQGISDPKNASNLVRRGAVTYKQAKNLQQAGNIDSLKFDAATGAITATGAFGISFIVSLFCNINQDISLDEAVHLAFLSGLKNGTITISSSILTSQILRTEFGRNLAVVINRLSKNGYDAVAQSEIGRKLINNILKNIYNKPLYGGAARQAFIKSARINAITNTAVFLVMSLPDTYSLLKNEMSGKQFVKNLVVSGTGIGGAVLGSALGGMLGPVGMIAGGFIGGLSASIASKVVADKISKDDSEKMMELVKVALIRLSNDYLIQSNRELSRVWEIIRERKLISTNLLKLMYTIGADNDDDLLRVNVAYGRLNHAFSIVARQRTSYHITDKDIFNSLDSLTQEE